jgi:hypothetical protein
MYKEGVSENIKQGDAYTFSKEESRGRTSKSLKISRLFQTTEVLIYTMDIFCCLFGAIIRLHLG